MKALVLLGLLILLVGNVYALSTVADSDLVTLDTVPPTLNLLTPNGGETWYIGDTQNILYSATDAFINPNSIKLWYSLNGGTTYLPIAQDLYNSGTYAWQLPSVQSNSAKVRIAVSDLFGNLSQVSSAGVFALSYVPPAIPTGVNVQITNNVNAHITWNAVTNTIPPYNSPITPDGYIVLYNETPYEDDQYYYFLGETDGLSYTHYRVARFRPQMYYRVVAYKDFEGRMAELLAARSTEAKTSWADIKNRLSEYRGGGK